MDRQLEFECTIEKEVYNSPDYKIYGAIIDEFKYPNIEVNNYGNITIVGNFHKLTEGITYKVKAIEGISKYGKQYQVLNIKRDVPTNKEETAKFLYEILTENQAHTLLEVYPDIVNKIIDNNLDDIDLSKTKGIKEKTFENIKDKVMENFALVEIIDRYGGYGLTISMLKKLYNKYASIEKIEYELKTNPYRSLCNISGIGFKKADNIILNLPKDLVGFEFDIKTSKERMLSCVDYLLLENEKDGHTKINIVDLRNQCIDLTPECIEHFVNVVKDEDDFYLDRKTKFISRRAAYETEKYIADKIKELLDSPRNYNFNWQVYNEIDGNGLTERQLQALKNLSENNISLLAGSAGCVDMDTEYFNGVEWKKISDYTDDEQVLQYNEDRTANLVKPIQYHKYKAEYLHKINNYSNSINQVLSDEHNVVYLSSKGHINKIKMKELIERHNTNSLGFNGRFITTFEYSGKGINLSDDEIRLMVAIIADGSFQNDICRFHLKKDRKKKRLLEMLNRLGVKYKMHNSNKTEYVNFYVYKYPRKEKGFTKFWYNCSNQQLQVIIDEVLHWDGSFGQGGRRTFSTTIKSDADFIQFAFSACGYRTTLHTYDRVGEEYLTAGQLYTRQSVEYNLCITQRKNSIVSIMPRHKNKKIPIVKYKTKDGFKYCFTVPSGMLVLRRNDRIFITGNSGKSFTTQSIIQMLDDNKLSYILMTPTGKASRVLSEYSKRDAMTIHRGLGYNPSQGWLYNENNKLNYDVVIIDEAGMIDIYIMKRLLEAIDTSKTKLLFIQDPSQLPSVGAGNCSDDIIKSDRVPLTVLDKIFRYAEGGLYNVATKIRNGEYYISKTDKKVIQFGECKDYTFLDIDQDDIVESTVNLYEKLIREGNTIDDIMVLSHHNKGEYGCKIINEKIQSRINPIQGKNHVSFGKTKFIEGDKVLQVVNNYKAKTILDEEASVFNGNTGIIKQIIGTDVIIEFDGKQILYTKDNLSQLLLGYAISIHKSQGSSCKNVIVITPKAHTFFINRNLLYTAITRTKLKCFHFGNKKLIKSSLKKSAIKDRQTFLCSLLKQ